MRDTSQTFGMGEHGPEIDVARSLPIVGPRDRRSKLPSTERFVTDEARRVAGVLDVDHFVSLLPARPGASTGPSPSPRMIERHYGALLDGAHAAIADRLDALDAARVKGVRRPGRSRRHLHGQGKRFAQGMDSNLNVVSDAFERRVVE